MRGTRRGLRVVRFSAGFLDVGRHQYQTPAQARRVLSVERLAAAERCSFGLDKGRVVEGNFDSYDVLRIDEMPSVEVHIVKSSAPPTGVGEPGVSPIGPAVANAMFNATRKRIRILPFGDSEKS